VYVTPLRKGVVIRSKVFYARGTSRSEVFAFIIVHGGRTGPGGHTDPTWAKTAGKTTMSINATELMWAFFETHPKP